LQDWQSLADLFPSARHVAFWGEGPEEQAERITEGALLLLMEHMPSLKELTLNGRVVQSTSSAVQAELDSRSRDD